MGVLFILLSLLLGLFYGNYTIHVTNSIIIIACRAHVDRCSSSMHDNLVTLHVYNMEEMHEGFYLNCTYNKSYKDTLPHSI